MKKNKKHSEKFSYVISTRGLLTKPTQDRIGDGKELARQCLDQIEDRNNFPPQLFILLSTVHFQPFEDLVKGIEDEIQSRGLTIPLIGCSVAGIITEKSLRLKGAILVCIASRFLNAKVAHTENLLSDPNASLKSLCEKIFLCSESEKINPDLNRFMVCFLPGFVKIGNEITYKAVEILYTLRDLIYSKIPMVGGVAADNFKRKNGWIFTNNRVDQKNAAIALIESEVRFGIGLAHGLDDTGEIVYIGDVIENGQRILNFQRYSKKIYGMEKISPKDLRDEYRKKGMDILYGEITPEKERRIILYPDMNEKDGSAFVARPVMPHFPVEILKCDSIKIQRTLLNTLERAEEKGYIDRFHSVVALCFPCAGRYKYIKKFSLPFNEILNEFRQDFPQIPLTAGLMFGEIGLEPLGRSVIRSFTVTGLLLSDQFIARMLQKRVYQALIKMEEKNSESVPDVIKSTVQAMKETGISGGMISLVFKDKDVNVIVAQDALGENWKSIVPLTIRKANRIDILTVISQSLSPKFVPDSRIDKLNDQEAVRIAKVISQSIFPLKNVKNELIGLLQFDLGDMSHINTVPESIFNLLQAFASQVAITLSRAIDFEELSLSKIFDQALTVSMTKNNSEDAAQAFIQYVVENADHFDAERIHLRLITPDRKFLRLIAGAGDYYQVARLERQLISIEFDSPNTIAFRKRKTIWINDVREDNDQNRMLQSLPEGKIKELLEKEKSTCDVIICADDEAPIGVLIISSLKPWFFTNSRCRSIQTLGRRLYFILKHAERRQAEQQKTLEIQFLLETTPHLTAEQDIKISLKNNAKKIASASRAAVVSFFLWDEEHQALILRGQHGWKVDMVGKARYQLGQGMTGTLAMERSPSYISDLNEWKTQKNLQSPRYESEMFGQKLLVVRYEAIAIPLYFQKLLGILTLQNALPKNFHGSIFTTIDTKRLIAEVADDLTSFIYAAMAHEDSLYRIQSANRLHKLDNIFIKSTDISELFYEFCINLLTLFKLDACALFLFENDLENLGLKASAGLDKIGINDITLATDLSGINCKIKECIEKRTIIKFKPEEYGITANSADSIDNLPLLKNEIKSFAAIPLIDTTNVCQGVLAMWNIRNYPEEEYPWFTARDLDELAVISQHLLHAKSQHSLAEARLLAIEEQISNENRLTYMGSIVGIITHDLRSRLAEILYDIRTVADFGLMKTEEELSVISRLETVTEKLSQRITSYLDIMNQYNFQPDKDTILNEIIKSALERCYDKINAKKINIHLQLSTPIKIKSAPLQLEVAFYNIIENAIQAMEESGQLSISAEIHESSNKVSIRIIDSGRGIPESDVPKILNGIYSSRPDGRPSMGLFLGKYIIEQHQGKLEIMSEVGRGTMVQICLPIIIDKRRD